MKKFLEKIWKFVNSRIFGYIVLIIFIVFFIGTCNRANDLKDDLQRTQQNISALDDSITTVVKKNGNLEVSIDGYIASTKELSKYNKELAEAIKNQKGKVITLNQIVFNLKQDNDDLREYIRNLPDPEPPVQEDDSTWTVSWSTAYVYDSINYDRYDGKSRIRIQGPVVLGDVVISHLGTNLTYRDSQIKLSWGQKWEGTGKDRRLRVFAETSHPAFKAKLLQGTYVDYPTKKHWFTGFGIGPQLNIGYDFLNNQPAIVIGIGIHFNIYQF